MDNKILVVEDEEVIRDFLKTAFTEAGYAVHCAESAEKARDVLKQQNIQVMFLDLQLPGLSGEELCCRIRRDDPIAIIYAMTGYGSRLELAFCRDSGFDDYFTKPVDLKVLLTAAADGFKRLNRWKEQQDG